MAESEELEHEKKIKELEKENAIIKENLTYEAHILKKEM